MNREYVETVGREIVPITEKHLKILKFGRKNKRKDLESTLLFGVHAYTCVYNLDHPGHSEFERMMDKIIAEYSGQMVITEGHDKYSSTVYELKKAKPKGRRYVMFTEESDGGLDGMMIIPSPGRIIKPE